MIGVIHTYAPRPSTNRAFLQLNAHEAPPDRELNDLLRPGMATQGKKVGVTNRCYIGIQPRQKGHFRRYEPSKTRPLDYATRKSWTGVEMRVRVIEHHTINVGVFASLCFGLLESKIRGRRSRDQSYKGRARRMVLLDGVKRWPTIGTHYLARLVNSSFDTNSSRAL